MPVLISEIHDGQPAHRCGGLFIGDAILAVNGIDLRQVKHDEAVEILSRQVHPYYQCSGQRLCCLCSVYKTHTTRTCAECSYRQLFVRGAVCVQNGDIDLDVVFVAPDDDSDDDNLEYEDETGLRFDIRVFLLICIPMNPDSKTVNIV